jgi:cysteine desulfurase
MKKRIYLDHAATTYLDPRVKKAMEPFWLKEFGNPSSLYQEGRVAKKAIENARSKIAELIGAKSEEIIFTAGGTEIDNLAIFGVANGVRKFASLITDTKGNDTEAKLPSAKISGSPHIITTKFEHHAVLNTCKELEKRGFKVTYLSVGKEGIVNPNDVKKSLTNETILVSIMFANNEIGTIQPISEISNIIRNFRNSKVSDFGFRISDFAAYPLLHTDACQAAGYLDLDVKKLGVDLMTVNGSKIYGPKGIGFLYVRKGVKIQPILYGGEQERKMRPGTENVPAIVGLAKAFELVQSDRVKESKRLTTLRDYFIKKLLTQIPKTFLNGHATQRLPNNINISVLGVEGESVVLYLDEAGIACSTGSACTSASLEPSHVIMALGKPYEYGHGSLRFTLGRCNTKKDIDYVLKVLPDIIKKLRSISAVT